MSPSPIVSIIIRTKNEERWITSCFEALLGQDYQDFEIIVVDNQSTDKTIEKIRQFPVEKIINITDYLPRKALILWTVCLPGCFIARPFPKILPR